MRVAQLTVEGYRGFERISIAPRGHVLLLGEPRAGRSTLLDALDLALSADGPRGLSEFDLHNQDPATPILITTTLIDLSTEQQQRFIDQLELFDTETWAPVPVLAGPSAVPASAVPAIRIGYHARWDPDEQAAIQNRFWVRGSDPQANQFRRVQRADRIALGYASLMGRRPLNIAPRGGLRALIDERDLTPELIELLERTTAGMAAAADTLGQSEPVASAITDILELLRSPLGIAGPVGDIVRLVPDGGSLAAMLRGLVPTLDFADGAGYLPLLRHGSTAYAAVEAAELVTQGKVSQAIVAVDDFGDTLDGPTAQHLSEQLRRNVGQLWLSTRRPETARGFHLDEVYRLSRRDEAGHAVRRLHQAPTPSRGELPAYRELHRQILSAAASRTIAIVEGPDDLAGYRATDRVLGHHGGDGIAAHGTTLIDPGPKGGVDACVPLARLARNLGFNTIVVCDYDRDDAEAQERLDKLLAEADHVIRLPRGYAVEAAMVDMPDERVIATVEELATSYRLPLPDRWESLDSLAMRGHVYSALKSNGGLHSQYVYAAGLPVAGTAQRVIDAIKECATRSAPSGLVQL